MIAKEFRLPKELDKSILVFNEKGTHFSCPWHYHPEFELILVNKSSGKRMVGDHIGYFNEGDLVLMGPNIPHVWVSDNKFLELKDPTASDATVIHFTPDFIGEDIFNIPEFSAFCEILNLSSRGINIHETVACKIAEIMNKMTVENGLKRLSSFFEIFDLISSINEHELLASPNFTYYNCKGSNRHSRINEYILHNFHKQITLKEIAEEAHMSTTTFCNFFKEQYRMTFIEYVNQIRIGQFCKLISEKDKSILEAAYSCGFNSIANFNRQFKKIKGMSPSEFRREFSQN